MAERVYATDCSAGGRGFESWLETKLVMGSDRIGKCLPDIFQSRVQVCLRLLFRFVLSYSIVVNQALAYSNSIRPC